MTRLLIPRFMGDPEGWERLPERCFVGNVIVGFEEARSITARMCTNLVRFYPALESNEIQLLGSSSSIKYRGRYFVLATRHQLLNLGIPNGEFSDVGQLVIRDDKVVTSSGYFVYGSTEDYNDDDRYDLIAFFYDKQAEIYPELRERFFNLERPWQVEDRAILRCFALGCAFSDQRVDFCDTRSLNLVRRNHECRYLGPKRWQGLHAVEDLTGDSFDPDGMSGGAVMFIVDDPFGARIELGGIVQRGGASYYHYLDADHIARFLDFVIDRVA